MGNDSNLLKIVTDIVDYQLVLYNAKLFQNSSTQAEIDIDIDIDIATAM